MKRWAPRKTGLPVPNLRKITRGAQRGRQPELPELFQNPNKEGEKALGNSKTLSGPLKFKEALGEGVSPRETVHRAPRNVL